jgi:hypothetical protein
MRLFLFLFVLVFSALAGMTAAGVAIGVKFFHVDSAPWTDFSVWNARPFLVGGGLALVSGMFAGTVSMLWGMVTGLFRGRPSKEKKKVRPQSNRRTTV